MELRGFEPLDPLTVRPATPFNPAPGQARNAHNNSVGTGILFLMQICLNRCESGGVADRPRTKNSRSA